MALPYAEVIGDPVAHSKSPLIHKFWLEKLGISADYRIFHVQPRELASYLDERRRDTRWRGCNVTAPLKGKAAELVGAPAGLCDFVGAVNCIVRTPLSCLAGTNTDLNGLDEALTGADFGSSDICIIGAGGSARAALCYLVQNGARNVTIIARNRARAEAMRKMIPAGSASMKVAGFEGVSALISSSDIVINATPMGMPGAARMPAAILDGFSAGQLVFDMVYEPVDTELMSAAKSAGARTVGGLTMLIGQAAPAFELFFGMPAPRQHDGELARLLSA